MTRGEALLAWYAEHGRDLPWRHTTDPYRILVSEVMLQQTPVARVAPAYTEFLARFPDEKALATAPLDTVLAAWQGLGYPARARRLRAAMQIVVADGWPTDPAGLQGLPGVGPYTAAAVASIAFGREVAVVDTNVRRILARWLGRPVTGRDLNDSAQSELTGDPATWNQAMMDLGATVCRPRPRCDECPVTAQCTDPSIYLSPPRQARYEGSLRQVRGEVLRALRQGPATVVELARATGHAMPQVEQAVDGLAIDGLVERGGDSVRIPR